MLTSPLALLLIAVFVYLVRDWRKRDNARQAAKQWEDDNKAVKVAEWLDSEMCKQDPDWRKHAAEEEGAKEARVAASLAKYRAGHPEEVEAEKQRDLAWQLARKRS